MNELLQLQADKLRACTRFIMRDYYEIQDSQISYKGETKYANKSIEKIKEKIQSEFSNSKESIIFNDLSDANSQEDTLSLENDAYIFDISDGLYNFKRAMPFFSISMTFVKRIEGVHEPIYSIIYFPILGEFYYAQRRKGAMKEYLMKNIEGYTKLKCSANKDLATPMVVVGDNYEELIKINQELNELKLSSFQIRLFGSDNYALILFISGSCDKAIFSKNMLTKYAISLFVEESGGVCQEHETCLMASFA